MRKKWGSSAGNALFGVLLLVALTGIRPLLAQFVPPPPPEAITDRQGLPQSYVPAIVQDKQGFIWMATLDGLARYDGHSFRVFHPPLDGRPGLSSAGLENMLIDPKGNLWIKTYQGDLDYFDPRRETVLNFSRQPLYQQAVGRDTLDAYYPDERQRLWLSLRHRGLLCLDLKKGQVQRFRHNPVDPRSLSGAPVTAIDSDGQGRIWVATPKGLDRFDEQTGTFVPYRHRANDPTALPEPVVRALHRRKNGDLLLLFDHHLSVLNHRTGHIQSVTLPTRKPLWWHHHIGTDSQGNDYIDGVDQILRVDGPARDSVIRIRPLNPPTRSWANVGLFVDRSDVLWVGTDATGVRKFNLRAGLFSSQPYRQSFHADVLRDILHVREAQMPRFGAAVIPYNLRSAIDRSGQLWLTVGEAPFYRFNFQTRQLTAIPFPVGQGESGSDRPSLLATDPAGQIWAMHDSLAYTYQEATGGWKRFPFVIHRAGQRAGAPLAPLRSPKAATGTGTQPGPRPVKAVESSVLQWVIDEQALWLITGARGLYRVDRQTGQIGQYTHQPADPNSLSGNNLYCLFADTENADILWVGTVGAGLCQFNKRTGHCQRITTRDGLPNNVIYTAIPDRLGHVWIATNRGLCRLDRRTGKTRTYTREDGLAADEFNRFHSLVLPEGGNPAGRLVLGGVDGLTVFAPARLEEDHFQPEIALTNLLVNNRPLQTDIALPLIQHLTLPHNQNFLTVDFAALQFNNPSQLRYRYQLEGYNEDWVHPRQPEAVYTNLSPGTYTLRLNASNTGGQWSRHVRVLTITIRPPWWATWWAWLIYTGLATGVVAALLRGYQRRRAGEQLRQLTALKERFFANITHDLRTPLTLILGPAEKLKATVQEPANQKLLATIDQNAHQLLGLINQLLDLSRLEAGVVRVNEQYGDVGDLLGRLVESMRSAAADKGLHLVFDNQLANGLYWFDAEKLERIALNLLSNAVKFTHQGSITVTVQPGTGQPGPAKPGSAGPGLKLVVEDTGIGLSVVEQQHVFNRFYQARPSSLPGSGIGLSLVKELVDLQGGTITVDRLTTDAPDSPATGTCFTVTLPYRQDALPALPADAPPTAAPPTTDQPTEDRPLVLVVEDNAALGDFIAECLVPHYHVLRAADGLEGVEKTLANGPDLVLSDVVMPGMDGFTLCQTLKNDPRTSHIPILLLTAKTTFEDRRAGLAGGADDYLAKPFHVDELLLRIRNRLAQRQQQRDWLRTQLASLPQLQPEAATGQPQPLAEPPAESTDSFLTKLDDVLAHHLDDAQFGVEELALAVGMSRVHLYRKVKALSGLTVNELIRNYRLKRAVALLETGHSVTEVGYLVGFDTPSYFTRSFRALYNLTPSDYQKQSREA